MALFEISFKCNIPSSDINNMVYKIKLYAILLMIVYSVFETK